MMTLILGFLTAHLGALIGVVVGASGLVFGAFRHQQANAATAAAAASVARSAASVSDANAAASAAGQAAAENRVQADAAAAALPASDLNSELAKLGALRKE